MPTDLDQRTKRIVDLASGEMETNETAAWSVFQIAEPLD
jgi:hypothetical protein